MKTLIIEDEFTSRTILQKALMCHGECHVAINGEEGFAVFKSAIKDGVPYDLICLDINLPAISGTELLGLIRQYEQAIGRAGPSQVKIIMTSGHTDTEVIVGSFRQGCESYLFKPIDLKKLRSEIKELGLIKD